MWCYKNMAMKRLPENKLQRFREQTKIPPKDICKYLHTDRIHYWRIEQGTRSPSFNLALKIVKFWRLRGFEISTEEIFFIRERKAKAARKLAA
jgi:DNA-binding XRE family transcriptional regulator